MVNFLRAFNLKELLVSGESFSYFRSESRNG